MGIWDKLLQDRGLASLDPSPLASARESTPESTSGPANGPALESARNALLALVKSSDFKQWNYENAWYCSNCGTVNGNAGTRKVVRKLCSKCKKARVGNQTALELILELSELELDKIEVNKETETIFDKVTEDLL